VWDKSKIFSNVNRPVVDPKEFDPTSYADRAGKYMGQQGVTLPKL
jgi:deoxycytidine triphosphate deaminase